MHVWRTFYDFTREFFFNANFHQKSRLSKLAKLWSSQMFQAFVTHSKLEGKRCYRNINFLQRFLHSSSAPLCGHSILMVTAL